jgi:hypothetical protein
VLISLWEVIYDLYQTHELHQQPMPNKTGGKITMRHNNVAESQYKLK